MKTKGKFGKLLDELIAGNPQSDELEQNLDLILSWLANPDADSVSEFREEYANRNISQEILRGYVLFVLEQKLFSKESSSPFDILGLKADTTKSITKSRYRKLIRIYHPDRGLGDQAVLNSHAEKINQAYKKIIDGVDTEVAVPETDFTVNSRTRPPVQQDNTSYSDDYITRKLRRKLGSVKQFQIVFFGAVVCVCLLLIVLIYFQSGNEDNTQSYYVSSTTNKRTIDKHEYNDNLENPTVNESESAEDLTSEVVEKNLNLNEVTETGEQSSQTELLSNDSEQIQPVEKESDTNSGHPESDLDAVNNENIVLNESASDINEVEKELEVDVKTSSDLDAELEVDSEDDEIKQQPQSSIADDQLEASVSTEAVADTDTKQKLPEEPENAVLTDQSKENTSSIEEQQQDEIVTQQTANQEIPDNKSVTPGQSASSLADVDTITVKLKAVVNESTVKKVKPIINHVPVKEVQIEKQRNPLPSDYKLANLFERRFAQKFVIRYLESIEKGNIRLLNDFLSDSLSVNGVANNKFNYLKNRTELITNSNKRAYRIKFIGDVLRLDKGSFRVTLQERETIYFKNNTQSRKSYLKSYDIKRYSHSSEIVSISDV